MVCINYCYDSLDNKTTSAGKPHFPASASHLDFLSGCSTFSLQQPTALCCSWLKEQANNNNVGPGCTTIHNLCGSLISLRRGTRTEPAILSRQQVASAGNDGGVLRQWLCLPLYRRQTPAPEEVKWQCMPRNLQGLRSTYLSSRIPFPSKNGNP